MRTHGFWKDLTFYFLIESYADVMLRAATEVQALAGEPAQSAARLQALSGLRQEANEAFRQFRERLDHAFITPLDKEDLLEILQCLDMLLEAIERAANGLQFAPVQEAEPVLKLTAQLHATAEAAFGLASSLRYGSEHGALPANLEAIQRTKQESNLLYDAAVKELGANLQLTPPAAVAAKEALDRLLAVMERSAELARLVARLLVKYA